MDMKILTAAELKRVLELHFRRHVHAARVDLDSDGMPALVVQFVSTPDKTNRNNIRTATN